MNITQRFPGKELNAIRRIIPNTKYRGYELLGSNFQGDLLHFYPSNPMATLFFPNIYIIECFSHPSDET